MTRRRPGRSLLIAAARSLVGSEPGPWSVPDADPATVLSVADDHAVTPALHGWLGSGGVDVPEPLRRVVAEAAGDIARSNLLRAGELVALSSALEEVGVPLIALKGPVLAQQGYGSLALRQFLDLDLLVRWDDLARVYDVLLPRGYTLEEPVEHLVDAAREGGRPRPIALAMRRADGRVALDLHTVLSHRLGFTLDVEGLWERRVSVGLGGRMVSAPSPLDLLHYLCVHGTQHGWARLGWVVDVAQMIRRHPDADWTQLLQRATRLGSSRMVRLGATLAADMLGVSLPDALQRSAREDRAVPGLSRWIQRRMFEEEMGPLTWTVERYAVQLRAWDRAVDRVRHLANVAVGVTVQDYAAVALPRSAFGFYPLIRPWRLGRALLRVSLRRPEETHGESRRQ